MFDKEYIQKKRESAKESVRIFNSDEINRAMLREGRQGDGPGYEGGTFLYIRAYDGDKGIRPIPSGINFWLSPDIELYKEGVLVDTTNPLVSNTNYTVKVTITNDGDLDCYSCTVDLYLCDVSIGFSVNASQNLGVLNARVLAHSTTTVEFPFTTTSTMSGHKCMFARVYSLITNDYPADFVNFITNEDRHIGQQNLNIVKQGEPFYFHVDRQFRMEKQKFEVVLKPDPTLFKTNVNIQMKYVEAVREFDTSKFNLIREIREQIKPEIITKPGINIKPGINLKPGIIDKLNIGKTRLNQVSKFENLKPRVEPTSKLEKISYLDQGKWLHQFDSGINKIKVEVPMLDLKENEAVPMSLTVKDPETGEIIGGITVLVVG